MFLSQTRIVYRANEHSLFSGIDSYENCDDKSHFTNYPWKISYDFNSRGFRDQEWPETLEELQNSIWCLGDSATVGVGSPLEHTWPQVLQQLSGTRTINISLEGASNNWIARHARSILAEIKPKFMVIQWSYSHRRELDLDQLVDPLWREFYHAVKDPSWPDCDRQAVVETLPEQIKNELKSHPRFDSYYDRIDIETDRRLFAIDSTVEQDLENTQECIDMVVGAQDPSTVVIHSFIPQWHTEKYSLNFHGCPALDPIIPVDLARDGWHFDIKTSESFVTQLLNIINHLRPKQK